jgi:hypothetical protein
MRRSLMVFLMLGLTAPAIASVTGPTPDLVKNPGPPYVNPQKSRTAGENMASAIVIAGPGTFTGSTTGFVNDYDEVCPYAGSTAPDVVYAFTPTTDITVHLDLCDSSFDTKLYVYDNVWTPGFPLACNDDFHMSAPCTMYTSRLEYVSLVAGHTYYIVVDGYGGQNGAYTLEVIDAAISPPTGACCRPNGTCSITTQLACAGVWQGENTSCVPNPCPPPPPVPCPAGALIEGEPPCVPGDVDDYNGGCNSAPTVFQTLEGQLQGCATMCGKSCAGDLGRDTDWFVSHGTGVLVTATCIAEFPLQFILIYGTDCASLTYTMGTADPGVPVTLSWDVASGAEVWFWVGNQGFDDWPESNYVLDVCGIEDQTENPTGACCAIDGTCTVTQEDTCSGSWLVHGTCSPNPCLEPTGSCCATNGTCTVTLRAACTGSWTMFGTCSPNRCVQPTGSCCVGDHGCSVVPRSLCRGGYWAMFGTCSPNPCPGSTEGSCCAADGTCHLRVKGDCLGHWTAHEPCLPNPCVQPTGSCCDGDGNCTVTLKAGCTGQWAMFGVCVPNPCDQLTGACCAVNGACTVTSSEACTGTWTQFGVCVPNPCPQPAACCAVDGTCTVTQQADCGAPRVWHEEWSTCSPNRCEPLGACCAVDSTCTFTSELRCRQPGEWHGDWLSCEPNPCLQALGACCASDETCLVTAEASCHAPSAWHGEWPSCDPNPCLTCVPVVVGTPLRVGETYTVALSTTDSLSEDPVSAFSVDLYVDPAFLHVTDVSRAGTMTEGNGLFRWREISPGLIRIVWAGVTALSGPGAFVNLIMEEAADAPCGECTTLDLQATLLNEGEPCAVAVDGEFCVPTLGLSGRVTYFACDALDPDPPNPRTMSGVHLERVRDCGGGELDSLEVVTDGTGDYVFAGCPGCQDCLRPWLERSVGSPAISSWDASLILSYLLLLDPLDRCMEDAAVYDPTGVGDEAVCPPPAGFEAGLELGGGHPGNPADYRILPQKAVADVSRNQHITALDASLILKYVVGNPEGMASKAGEWSFYCASRCYAPATAITTADFVGLLGGDVSGNWAPVGPRSGPTGPPILVTEILQPLPNRLWQATISVEDANGYLSGDFRMSVRQSDWELVQVRLAPPASNGLVESRLNQDELRLAMAGAEPVDDGAVLLITLRSRTEIIGSVPELAWAEINDGSRPVELQQPTAVPWPGDAISAGPEFRVDPNPSHDQVRLTIRVAEAGPCLLEIFAPDGRVVRRLTEGTRAAGVHTVLWDGRGDQGAVLPSGVYFARLRLGKTQVEQRLVMLR